MRFHRWIRKKIVGATFLVLPDEVLAPEIE
jgi:hypothetical protein